MLSVSEGALVSSSLDLAAAFLDETTEFFSTGAKAGIHLDPEDPHRPDTGVFTYMETNHCR